MNNPEKLFTIFVDIRGGALQGIYGDQLPTDCQINFVLRDHDNIAAGDADPLPEDTTEQVHYW